MSAGSARKMAQISKAVWLGTLIVGFFSETFIGRIFVRGQKARRTFYLKQGRRWAIRGLKAMGVECRAVHFSAQEFNTKNCLLVGNHMSYVDVMILQSWLPSVFVTSVDMGEIPVLGDLAELGGAIFIERRDRSRVDRDLTAMTEALGEGFNVVIYPEGTSTDGRCVLPFKKSLLMAAVAARRDIQPICLRYIEVDGEPFDASNANKICWYGKMRFAPHFFGLMAVKKLRAELVFLEPIPYAADLGRDEIAARCFAAIDREYFRGREGLRSEPKAEQGAGVNTAVVDVDGRAAGIGGIGAG